MAKSVVQVLLISLAKTVGKQEELAHHILYMAVLAALLLYSFK
jgi:hypothetical protein